jgi:site-specific DNA recombinase
LSLEELVWKNIEVFIKRPQELYDIFRKQSVDSRDYDTYTKERERRQIELERLEDADLSTELDYRKGMLSEEKYEKVLAKISQDREACEKQIQDIDEKLDSIVQAEEMKISLEEFSKTIETKIENLSFSQKKHIINILVRDIVVTRENSRPVIAINYRFQPSKV